MTSIRAFSEILIDEGSVSKDERQRYSRIIHEEGIRLTRLLDDLLDLSVLENGQVSLNEQPGSLRDLLDRAVAATSVPGDGRALRIRRNELAEAVPLFTDTDRLSQVFINIIANAQKYCDAKDPVLRVEVRNIGKRVAVDFIDNGQGIPKKSQAIIF
jgi:signal transduction histidine kinase